jgi:HEAT repeat protein
MCDGYQPTSDFLKMIFTDSIPLHGSDQASVNFQRLIAMTRDDDVSNRDWATFFLSQQNIDTPEVRAALIEAVQDENENVRAEALLGIAQIDAKLATPFVLKELSRDHASMPVFEAAMIIADPILIDSLRFWTDPSEDEYLDKCARDALAACQGLSSNIS